MGFLTVASCRATLCATLQNRIPHSNLHLGEPLRDTRATFLVILREELFGKRVVWSDPDMPTSAERKTTERDAADCPTAWFAVLERAIEDGDYPRAAKAQRELQRLGVVVKFPRRRRPTEKPARPCAEGGHR